MGSKRLMRKLDIDVTGEQAHWIKYINTAQEEEEEEEEE